MSFGIPVRNGLMLGLTASTALSTRGGYRAPAMFLNFLQPFLDSRITFSRGTGATRVNQSGFIELVGNTTPRFDYDPVTLAPRGLLIEEARTNTQTHSADISVSPSWEVQTAAGLQPIGSGSSINQILAPDGTQTADFIAENTVTGRHYLYGVIFSDAATKTWSVFLKAGARNKARIQIGTSSSNVGVFADVDLIAGTIGAAQVGGAGFTSAGTPAIQSFGNGWYRCSIPVTTTAVAHTGYVVLRDAAGDVSYTGNGTSGLYIWGGQMEAGSFVTSYIPTVASTVTRNAENLFMTGTNFSSWYNQSEGVFVYNATALSESSFTGPWQVNVTAGANANSMYSAFADTRQLRVYDGAGAEQVAIASSGVTPLVYSKVAAAYKLNDFAVSANGGTVATDTSGTLPTPIQMQIGGNNGALNGWIAQIAYFNTRLPNAQLQTLTAPSLATTLSLDFTSGSYNVGF